MEKRTSSVHGTRMELLAPAGSVAAFFAAIDAGADAVYVGAPGFNARALRKEFTLEDIAAMTVYAHEKQRRLYVAMNSLMKEQETYRVLETLNILERIAPDALIVQDLGGVHLARKFFPGLTLHASTLMSVHNRIGADFLTSYGFERVVLARELSLDDIRSIATRSNAQLEVFIHGAMCFSYSGLCLFSSMHGGKSSLRGRCVQPCRRQYQLSKTLGRKQRGKKEQKGSYLFSMNDLRGIDYLQELEALGVVSLKIEGRLKPVEYVRNTVSAYRLCLDGLQADEKEKRQRHKEADRLLASSMGRKSSSGFFDMSSGGMITPQFSGSAGVFIGQAEPVNRAVAGKVKGTQFFVRLKGAIKIGDRLRFQNERDDIRESFTLKDIFLGRKAVKQGKVGQNVMVVVPGKLEDRKGKVGKGLLFRVDTGERRRSEVVKGALKKGGAKKINPNRLFLDEISGKIGWSRPVTEQGEAKERFNGSRRIQSSKSLKKQPQWWIRLQALPSAKQKYPVRAAMIVVPMSNRNVEYIQAIGDQSTRLYPNLVWALPAVIHEEEVTWYQKSINSLVEMGFVRFQLGHISQVLFFDRFHRDNELFELYSDYTVNILNAGGLAYGNQLGLKGMQFSLEAERDTLLSSLGAWRKQQFGAGESSKMQIGMYVYGKPPLFTARADAPHLRTRDRVVSPRNEAYSLEKNQQLTVVRSLAPFVLLPHVREMMQMGVSYFILDLSGGPLKKELSELGAWLQGKRESRDCLKGNFDQGLL